MSDIDIKLYSYYRSSASYRVRIALNIKNINYQTIPVDLTNNGGENWSQEYLNLNPQGFVPALQDSANVITQSLAIIEYLEEKYPQPSLLPDDVTLRALSRGLAHLICTDIHPLDNLRVLDYLKNTFDCNQPSVDSWYCHWIIQGFNAIESLLDKRKHQSQFCYGDSPSIADLCLIPQVFNARRFKCNLSKYPIINQITSSCNELSAFKQALPENQVDATK